MRDWLKGGMEELLGDGTILDVECGSSYMMYVFVKIYRTVYLKRVNFIICKWYFNKPDLKKKFIVHLKFTFNWLPCIFIF